MLIFSVRFQFSENHYVQHYITRQHHICHIKDVKEARRQLYKNVKSNIKQILAATPDKAPTIQSPTTYHENYPS